MRRHEHDARQKAQDLKLCLAEEWKDGKEVDVSAAKRAACQRTWVGLREIDETHTKNPARDPVPNILPAQALPASC